MSYLANTSLISSDVDIQKALVWCFTGDYCVAVMVHLSSVDEV